MYFGNCQKWSLTCAGWESEDQKSKWIEDLRAVAIVFLSSSNFVASRIDSNPLHYETFPSNMIEVIEGQICRHILYLQSVLTIAVVLFALSRIKYFRTCPLYLKANDGERFEQHPFPIWFEAWKESAAMPREFLNKIGETLKLCTCEPIWSN